MMARIRPPIMFCLSAKAPRLFYIVFAVGAKGTAVSIPLGTTAPLTITGNGSPSWTLGGTSRTTQWGDHEGVNVISYSGASGSGAAATWNDPKLTGTANLATATAATINSLRQAFQIQKLYERDARGGTRYTELVRSHFGVVSPDARLQRSEYLGGRLLPLIFLRFLKLVLLMVHRLKVIWLVMVLSLILVLDLLSHLLSIVLLLVLFLFVLI